MFKYVKKPTHIICIAIFVISPLVTYPLDLTKTRLQIQGEATKHVSDTFTQARPHRGMLATILGIGNYSHNFFYYKNQ